MHNFYYMVTVVLNHFIRNVILEKLNGTIIVKDSQKRLVMQARTFWMLNSYYLTTNASYPEHGLTITQENKQLDPLVLP
jgi:hypothetical protein